MYPMYPVLLSLKSILIAYLHLIVITFLYRLTIAILNPLANLDEANQKRSFEHMAGFSLSQPATSAPPPNPSPVPAPPPLATIVSIPPPYIAPPERTFLWSLSFNLVNFLFLVEGCSNKTCIGEEEATFLPLPLP
jgi:hypothetical protein